jgi:hypothetical protein
VEKNEEQKSNTAYLGLQNLAFINLHGSIEIKLYVRETTN